MSEQRGPTVAVSIVVGANEAMIFGCLKSLFATTRDANLSVSVTVVDNNTRGTVAERIREAFPAVRVIRNTSRRGFAANHNAVLVDADADYFLILNDDVICLDGALEHAVAFLEDAEDGDVGVVGPMLLNPDRTLQPSTYSFPSVARALFDVAGLRDMVPTTRRLFRFARLVGKGSGRSRFWAHDRICDVETFAGAFMLVRRSVWESVGGMDEAALVGGEDTEWHYRIWQAGWRVVFLPGAKVIHFGSETVGRTAGVRMEYLKGYLNFFRRHRSRLTFVVFATMAASVFSLRWVVSSVLGNPARRAEDAAGLRTALQWLPVVKRR